MARGLEAEASFFGELVTSEVAHNLIALFLSGLHQRRAAFDGIGRAKPPREIAVVGAGLMGSGIAQAAAIGGAEVRLRDVDDATVVRGLASVRKLTRDAGRKGVVDRREAQRVVARVTGTDRPVRVPARGARDRGGVRGSGLEAPRAGRARDGHAR